MIIWPELSSPPRFRIQGGWSQRDGGWTDGRRRRTEILVSNIVSKLLRECLLPTVLPHLVFFTPMIFSTQSWAVPYVEFQPAISCKPPLCSSIRISLLFPVNFVPAYCPVPQTDLPCEWVGGTLGAEPPLFTSHKIQCCTFPTSCIVILQIFGQTYICVYTVFLLPLTVDTRPNSTLSLIG